jgi:nucleoside-diphosphate-sugar epimerase
MNARAPAAGVCAVTGANGFVGRELRRSLEGQGWSVVPWVRRVEAGSPGVRFALGQPVSARSFQGVDAVVHCAYDFSLLNWEEVTKVNVDGTQQLYAAAAQGGVKSIVQISTLSAFPGCCSLYGRAKLRMEELAGSVGARVIRPGLVYGDNPGGMFGRLVRQVRGSRFVPILRGGRQTQYLVHSEDLGELVSSCLAGRVPAGSEPIAIAHEQGWELSEILAQVARSLDRRIFFVPVPWRFAWLGLRTLELAGVKTNFRSDSLLSMVYQNPDPSFARVQALGFRCRPFRLNEGMLTAAGSGPE